MKIFMPANRAEPVYAPYIEHVPPDVTACIFWPAKSIGLELPPNLLALAG